MSFGTYYLHMFYIFGPAEEKIFVGIEARFEKKKLSPRKSFGRCFLRAREYSVQDFHCTGLYSFFQFIIHLKFVDT